MKTKMDFERKKFQKSEDQMNSKNFTKGNGSVNSKNNFEKISENEKNEKWFQNQKKRLKQIKDFHRTRPEDVTKPLSYEFEQMNLAVKQNEDLPNMVEFSDEEGYGRFLDLHEHYQRYVNIKGDFLVQMTS